MNHGTLIGRVVRVPKMFTGGKKPVAKFTVEVAREVGKSRDYVNVTAFSDWTDKVEQWLQAGTEVKVTYTVQSSSYEKDGKTIYNQDLVVTHLAPLNGSRKPNTEAKTEDFPIQEPPLEDANAEFGSRPHPDAVLA